MSGCPHGEECLLVSVFLRVHFTPSDSIEVFTTQFVPHVLRYTCTWSHSEDANITEYVLIVEIVVTAQPSRCVQASMRCRAASETCDLLSGHNRDECYASFGVDSERLDMYLGKALCLEAIFKGKALLRCSV